MQMVFKGGSSQAEGKLAVLFPLGQGHGGIFIPVICCFVAVPKLF